MNTGNIEDIPVLVVVPHSEYPMCYQQPRESIVEDGWAESLSLSPIGEIILMQDGNEIKVIDPLKQQA